MDLLSWGLKRETEALINLAKWSGAEVQPNGGEL